MKVIEELEQRVARYSAERYPVQHATAQFHLGMALTNADRLEEAEAALAAAAAVFAPDRLPLEHAKALNALGAVLRLDGRGHDAERAFVRAAAAFEAAGAEAEHGAARFNLGLVLRDLGELEGAIEAFGRAQQLLTSSRSGAQAAAAARELGATLLAAGELDAAAAALEEATERSERAGDPAGAGAAANVLGLVRLAADRPDEAIEAFDRAVAAHPRSLRPADHAMAKANLSLAYERAGDALRAGIAARQALGVPAAPEPVRAQAGGVAERAGGEPGRVLALLDEEPAERWAVIVREEMARWNDAPPAEREAEAGAWIDGQLARPATGPDLAEALVGALLELPPPAMEAMIAALVRTLGRRGPEAREDFRFELSRAMARFHVPQLERLRDAFNRAATELGEEATWR